MHHCVTRNHHQKTSCVLLAFSREKVSFQWTVRILYCRFIVFDNIRIIKATIARSLSHDPVMPGRGESEMSLIYWDQQSFMVPRNYVIVLVTDYSKMPHPDYPHAYNHHPILLLYCELLLSMSWVTSTTTCIGWLCCLVLSFITERRTF